MLYYLKITDVLIRVESPFTLFDSESTNNFFSDKVSDILPDFDFVYRPVDDMPVPENICHEEARRVYTGEGNNASTFFSAKPGSTPYAWVSRESLNERKLVCNYIPDKEYLMNYKKNVFTLMDIEATLLHFNAIILHASFIRWNGKGIVFPAPSGTGKSTQAALWEKYANAEILNGDRVALRKIDNTWRAYGLPIAGTSGIYLNESAPLTAVVALRQAKINHIRQIKGGEAFRYLYPETMIHRWDRDFERRATDLLLSVIQDIPIFLFECRPNFEAVEMLKEQIDN